ncbi:lectin C-type domain protein [Ancylostoma duodenale]|uniref:Lectin C-type domain protein n=1 Tax=Ancylostoma duodenale TaxID=51022 RepID=A0A0C2D7K6_9BILA|nr:lectin C-type domain protein [Ancylostoma duodenale]
MIPASFVRGDPCKGFTSTDWVKLDKTGFEYKLHCYPQLISFYNAERRCQEHTPPAHLASIHSEEENRFVDKMVKSRITRVFAWISLRKASEEEVDDCQGRSSIYADEYWDEIPCELSYPAAAVCKRIPPKEQEKKGPTWIEKL